jgi:glycosyltransferase involved in cell wall biosynthesis
VTARHIVVWQPVLTDHQAFTLEELSRQSGMPVIVYVARLEDAVRRAQGWQDTRVTSLERRLLPANATLRHCHRRLCEHRGDVHLFGSPFEQLTLMATLLMAAFLRLDFYLISEPYSPGTDGYFDDAKLLQKRLKAWLRPLAYRCYGLLIGGRAKGVFAISRLAVEQYRSCGFSAAKVFPFGYFVPCEGHEPSTATETAAGLRLVVVGSLIHRKGIDLLIVAVQRLTRAGHALTLDVFGPGDPSALAIDGMCIRYRGVIPFGQVQQVLAGYDLLVVPSRFDGWGVVVNEATCAQIPILCSDRVGARVIIERFGTGAVFAADDAGAMDAALIRLLYEPLRLTGMRAASAGAASAIEPAVAAAYMLAVISAPAPIRACIASPWYGKPA